MEGDWLEGNTAVLYGNTDDNVRLAVPVALSKPVFSPEVSSVRYNVRILSIFDGEALLRDGAASNLLLNGPSLGEVRCPANLH